MTPKMTEDQIIEEAVRLTEADMRYLTHSDYAEIAARHALRLATQPEQDPARITALEAENERLCQIVRRYGDRIGMATAPAELQITIDKAKAGGPHDAD